MWCYCYEEFSTEPSFAQNPSSSAPLPIRPPPSPLPAPARVLVGPSVRPPSSFIYGINKDALVGLSVRTPPLPSFSTILYYQSSKQRWKTHHPRHHPPPLLLLLRFLLLVPPPLPLSLPCLSASSLGTTIHIHRHRHRHRHRITIKTLYSQCAFRCVYQTTSRWLQSCE